MLMERLRVMTPHLSHPQTLPAQKLNCNKDNSGANTISENAYCNALTKYVKASTMHVEYVMMKKCTTISMIWPYNINLIVSRSQWSSVSFVKQNNLKGRHA